MSDSNEVDLSYHWMPFTANRQFKSKPRLLVAATGNEVESGYSQGIA